MVQSGNSSSEEHGNNSEKPKSNKRSQRLEQEYRTGWKMAGIGFEVATEVVAGALIGWGIDTVFSTGTRWTLIGSIAGICVGLLSLIRGTLKLNKQLELQEKKRKAKGTETTPPSNQESDQEDS